MDSRLQARIEKNLLAQISHGGEKFFGYIQDISKLGLGFACNKDMNVGDMVELLLNIPHCKSMRISCTVAWKKSSHSLSKNRFHYGARIVAKDDGFDNLVEANLKVTYERRAMPRFNETVEIRNDDVFDLLEAATGDVSASGLYIRSMRPLQIGAQIELSLLIESGGPPITCLAEVVAAFECDPDDENKHPYGAGVKIISFAGDDGKRFADYIRQLTKLYHFHWPEQTPSQ
jgi:hypothetical protein